jgi:hypothetical protein
MKTPGQQPGMLDRVVAELQQRGIRFHSRTETM